MSDDRFVYVDLVGGPLDSGQLPMEPSELEDPEPRFDFVPEDGSSYPPGCGRVLYSPEPGEDPVRWHWRGYVP